MIGGIIGIRGRDATTRIKMLAILPLAQKQPRDYAGISGPKISGNNIGQDLIFDMTDLVLEEQFPFFQTHNLKLII